jgi:DNA polymerase-3 subunit epsilon
VVVFYDVNDEAAIRFERFVAAHASLAQVRRAWHVQAKAPSSRLGSGRSTPALPRSFAGGRPRLTTQGPPVLVTTIAVPTLTGKKRDVPSA